MGAYQNIPAYPCVCQQDPATTRLEDYCELVNIGDGRSICESHEKGIYYWVSILADETPIVLCALEKYVGHTIQGNRKTDGLGVGWDQKGCAYIVFIELRRTLLNEEQWEDKLEQVKQAMELLCRTEPEVGSLHHQNVPNIFMQACNSLTGHKIAGIVIPIDRSRKRVEQSRAIRIGDKDAIIVALSSGILKKRTIEWSKLLTAIGI